MDLIDMISGCMSIQEVRLWVYWTARNAEISQKELWL